MLSIIEPMTTERYSSISFLVISWLRLETSFVLGHDARAGPLPTIVAMYDPKNSYTSDRAYPEACFSNYQDPSSGLHGVSEKRIST